MMLCVGSLSLGATSAVGAMRLLRQQQPCTPTAGTTTLHARCCRFSDGAKDETVHAPRFARRSVVGLSLVLSLQPFVTPGQAAAAGPTPLEEASPDTQRRTVLVLGGTGRVGGMVVKALLKRGDVRVLALVRSTNRLPAEILSHTLLTPIEARLSGGGPTAF